MRTKLLLCDDQIYLIAGDTMSPVILTGTGTLEVQSPDSSIVIWVYN